MASMVDYEGDIEMQKELPNENWKEKDWQREFGHLDRASTANEIKYLNSKFYPICSQRVYNEGSNTSPFDRLNELGIHRKNEYQINCPLDLDENHDRSKTGMKVDMCKTTEKMTESEAFKWAEQFGICQAKREKNSSCWVNNETNIAAKKRHKNFEKKIKLPSWSNRPKNSFFLLNAVPRDNGY